ncbi:hypothetical protein L3Q82_010353 [Scortum barcoo]|uniref:Uncharacterized protein n=1 Tax=Scortum barcoo TaxID=214431 RepID=A0ACB8WC61_9TELE|nr:hypothetical protein L3Q82_010353 [Scortum barcoo]
MATWARLPVGSPPAGRSMRGRCNVVWVGSSRGGGPRRPNPWNKTLAIGTWNVTSLGGKEPELCASGRLRAATHVLEFTPVNERVASLRLRVGDRSLAVVCAYGPVGQQQYRVPRPSWSPWEGYLIVLRLGTPLFYWGLQRSRG